MEYLIAAQDVLVAAAADLEGIGSALAAANRAAEAPTTGLLAAGADEVSAAIASLFSGNAQAYQALSAQAAAFHQQFVRALSSAAGSYAAAEAANASPMQAVLDVVNGPTQLLLGRPLIGDGANGGPGQNGGDGGLLYGNGGNGGSSSTPGQPGGRGGAAGLIGNGGAGGAAGLPPRRRGAGRDDRLRRGAAALAAMIASVGAVCDLDLAVIGGGVAKSGRLLFEPLRAALADHARLDFLAGLRVVPAELGGAAGLVGAARLAAIA